MVPGLPRLIEELALGLNDQHFEAYIGLPILAIGREQLIEFVDVTFVMLTVVEFDRVV